MTSLCCVICASIVWETFPPHDISVSHSTIQPANKPNPKPEIFSVTFGAAIKNMDKVTAIIGH